MKRLLGLVTIVAMWAAPGLTPALAASLSFTPTSQSVGIGQPVTVQITVDGLGAGMAPSVGAFDLDVTFDPAVLLPTAVDFGLLLGDPDALEALTSSSLSSGLIDLAEVSLLAPSDLDALQPSSFTLATLSFISLAVGTSPLAFTQAFVDDAFAARIALDVTGGTVDVAAPPGGAVPMPASLVLLGAAMAAWLVVTRRRAASAAG